jgi:hypothetical protein
MGDQQMTGTIAFEVSEVVKFTGEGILPIWQMATERAFTLLVIA